MAHTPWSREIHIGSQTPAHLTLEPRIVLGSAITAIASLLFDFKKAVDNKDTAKKAEAALLSDLDAAAAGQPRLETERRGHLVIARVWLMEDR